MISPTRLAVLVLVLAVSPALAQRQFGFDNRKPSGMPYRPPAETAKSFRMQPGWEASLFAGEPDLVNPIAFTIDEKGRFWVVECFEYPKRTPPGKKPRDRIRILEDTDGDGKCDKSTIWAEGKDLPIGWDLASGIEVGHGGVFLGAPPYLFFLSDPENKGRCTKQQVLLKGFGSQDTHETLNTFQWGPDGKLYGLHGVFTHSQVDGVKMNAAVWRYTPRPDGQPGPFEIFAEGTSNPWGMDFDRHGQCYLCCCVIPHLFHMVPGGTYKRQAGQSFNPYAYGLLNEICDHTHHKLSGWAHAGLIVLEGEDIPKGERGRLVMGSIHGCSLKTNTLKPNGSTFIGSSAPDFMVSGDKNVRPINLRWGADGAIYLIDWHDQNPCHQALPESWDYERGRIYRLAPKGLKPGQAMDLTKASGAELVGLLTKENPYWYRTASRVLEERKDRAQVPALKKIVANAKDPSHALRALWVLDRLGACDSNLAQQVLEHASPWMRAWGVRLLGERDDLKAGTMKRLADLAENDPSPVVRSQLASTAQRLGKQEGVLGILNELMLRKEDAKDPNIPLLVWLAYEPHVVGRRNDALEGLRRTAADNPLVLEAILPRTMRRLAATGKEEDLNAALEFIRSTREVAVRRAALDGLAAALKGRQIDAPAAWKELYAELLRDTDAGVLDLARRLAVTFQDREAIRRALAVARDDKAALPQRLDAVRDLGLAHPVEALGVLEGLARGKDQPVELRVEAVRALAGYDRPELAQAFLKQWQDLPPLVRSEVVRLLAARKPWATALLDGVGRKTVARGDLNDNVILRILGFKDAKLNQQVEKVWGKFRDSPKELAALIDRMRGEMHQGTASFEKGKLVFQQQCAKCHKFEGKGATVGPELDGAARDLEYLLGNILDPNRVIGQPYLLRLLELEDGRVETGLLHAEDDQTVTLKVENDQLKTFLRKKIVGKVQVLSKSMMPEGLAASMSVQDLRDLVQYVQAHPFLTEFQVVDHALRTGPAGRLRLGDVQPGVKVSTPLTVEVVAEKAGPARLLLGTLNPVTVFLNFDEVGVFRGPKGSELRPDMIAVDLTLKKGVNHLVLAVAYEGRDNALYARFLDPHRILRYRLPQGK